jgi:hypothetical protein
MVATVNNFKVMDLLKILENEFNLRFGAGIDLKEVNDEDPNDGGDGPGSGVSSENTNSSTDQASDYEPQLIKNRSTERIQASNNVPASTTSGVKNLPDIIADAARALNVKVFYARSSSKNAAGTYSPSSGGIRLSTVNNLDVAIHEIGHAIDDFFGVFNKIPVSQSGQIMDELQWFADRGGSNPNKNATSSQKSEYLKREGIAEFVRSYAINNQEAQRRAPEFFKHFESIVTQDAVSVVKDFGDDYLRYINGTNLEKIIANIEMVPKEERSGYRKFIESFYSNKEGFGLTFWDQMRTRFTNSQRPFDAGFDYLNLLASKDVEELLPDQNASMMARLFSGVNSKVKAIFTDGVINGNNEFVVDGRTNERMNLDWLYGAFDSTSDETLARDQALSIGYMFATRTIEKSIQFDRQSDISGISAAGDKSDVDVAMEYLMQDFGLLTKEEKVRVLEGARRYRLFSDNMLKYMVDKGRMSKENYNDIKEKNLEYVAFLPVQESQPGVENIFDNISALSAAANFGSVKKVVKAMSGSTALKRNPYISLMQNTSSMVKEADRNEVLQAFIQPMLSSMRSMGQGDVNPFADIMIEVTAAEKTSGKNVIEVFIEGKAKYFMFSDSAADVYQFIKGIGKLPRLPGIVTALPNLIRYSVTRFPVFAARNLIRDTFGRLIITRTDSKFGDFVKQRDGEEALFGLYGGNQDGYYMSNRLDYYKLQNQIMKDITGTGKGFVFDPVEGFKKNWSRYEDLLAKGETSNRLAEFRSAYSFAVKPKVDGGLGMDEYNANLYAAYQARDLMDFAVAGTWMRWINAMIPFANAQVQGLKRSVKAISENPEKAMTGFALRLALYTVVPQVFCRLLAVIGGYDDEYDNLPPSQKDMFYNFKLPVSGMADKWIIIPKPFDLGLVSAGVDRTIGYASGNKNAFRGYEKSLFQTFALLKPEMSVGPFSAIVEPMVNYSFFKEKAIVPRFEEDKILSLRGRFNEASRMSKGLSVLVSPFFKEGDSVDPRYIDNMFGSMFSYYGELGMSVSDLGSANTRHQFGLKTTGFVRSETPYGDVRVERMYDLAGKLGMLSSRDMKELGSMIKDFYNVKTAEERHRLYKQITKEAQIIYSEWEKDEVYKNKIKDSGIEINFD